MPNELKRASVSVYKNKFFLAVRMCLPLVLIGGFQLSALAKSYPDTRLKIKSIALNIPVEQPVSGRVVDGNGKPLAGASITIKGTGNGTSTNANGEFTINVPDSNSVLVISYIGFESKEVTVGGQTVINISLTPITRLGEEVVVVGYGTQRKIDVTGATGSVRGTELAKQPVLTATQAIQGKIAGVQIINNGQPGTNPTVRIRGTGTMLAGADPLYVVDGIIVTDITNINTADILSVDVLKDASSTAIYGARGANGVIIITTRQGNGKMKISYNGTVGIESATNLVQMANAQQYANYVSASTFGLTPAASIIASAGSPTGTSTDWYRQILRSAVQQRHSISLSGSTDNDRYYLSLGYEDDEGIVLTSEYKRINVRYNNEFKISDKLKLGTLISYANANDQQANLATAYNDAYRASPLIPGIVDGKYGNVSEFQRVVGNPILDLKDDNHDFTHNRFEGSSYLEYKPIKSLTLRSSLGGDLEFINERDYHYQFASDTTTFLVAGGAQNSANSSLSATDTKNYHWVWDNTATFNKRIGKSNLTVLAGTTAEEFNTGYINALRQNVPSDPSLWFINVGNANSSQNNSSQNKFTRLSYLGRVNYSYNDRYLFTGTIRADASSVFPSNNRWGYFPSAGVGWVLSKENFMQSQNVFQILKLRGSYGEAGNDNIPVNSFIPTLLTNQNYPFPTTQVNGVAIAQLKDQNLKWEITDESDVALEFSALHNRLSGEIGYYNKKTKNALINVLISATSGSQPDYSAAIPVPAGSVLTNAASISNTGVELALGWNDKINKNVSYHINGNISFNKNNVVGLNGGQPILDGQVNNDRVTKSDNGQPIGSFYVRQVIGVFQSQSEIDNYVGPNGPLQSANPGDLKYAYDKNGNVIFVYAGSYQPKAFYGISIGMNYKSLDFSVDGYGTYGGKIYNGKRQNRINEFDNVEESVAVNAFPATKNNPGPNQGNQPSSTYFVESGDYLRINNATIGYTMPGRVIENLKIITSLRIYVTGQNLVTFKKYSGFTPELPGTSPTNAGIETNTYPTSKVIAFGLNVGFD